MPAVIEYGEFIALALFCVVVISTLWLKLRLRLNQPVVQKSEVQGLVSLVALPVVVTDWRGRFVRDLRGEDFRVFEDGRPQPVAGFREYGLPLTIGLIVDSSESMRYKHSELIEMAFGFVEATDPMDEVFVVNFNDRPCFGLPPDVVFSSNVDQLEEAIRKAEPEGKTALFDAVLLAMERIKLGSREGKCLVVMSDGCDDASTASLEYALTEAGKSCVLIHALGIFDLGQTGSDRGFLELAKMTGGQAHILDSSQIVPSIGRRVARELHEYYTLLYATSERIQPGAFRKVRVVARVSPWRKFSVHTRAGYLTRSDLPRGPVNGQSISVP